MSSKTPLQVFSCTLLDLRQDAREWLTDAEYEAWIDFACEVIGSEAGRLFVGRILRSERQDIDEAA